MIREIATCLRLIECEPKTQLRFSDELQKRAYEFWEYAKEDILAEWQTNTDPINLQPKVKRLNRQVAEFIRKNSPTDLSDTKVNDALDILESPWPRREELMLRAWFNNDDRNAAEHSRFLIEEVHKTGLLAMKPPKPLPPIQPDDIELLCWMGIETEK